MSRVLFLLTISPVQSFIAEARKTQDLYSGSYILSHFCRKAILTVEQKYKAVVIFPNTSTLTSLPNRFLAVINTQNPEKLKEIGKDVESVIQTEILAMTAHILNSLNLPIHQELKQQVENYFQINWIFYPLEDHKFKEAFTQSEKYLNAIKNVKSFKQLAQDGRKCSITGEHTALYYRKGEKNVRRAIAVHENFPAKFLAENEALGGIAFIKRCAEKFFMQEYNSKFPSTARIALMDALYELSCKDDKYKNILEKEFDEQGIFKLFHGIESDVEEFVKEIYKDFRKYEIKFSPYYVVLNFDGDSMGKLLTGKIGESELKPGVELEEFHKYLSMKLGLFAQKARQEILVQPRGITVYAGGDDFLGLVNIKYLFDVLKELREEFESIVDLSNYIDGKLTFSAGISISHYRTPLSEALSWSRSMEKASKEIDDYKNALGIALLKHSGEIKKFIYKWERNGTQFLDIMSKGISYMQNDFSDSFIKNFMLEFRGFMDAQGDIDYKVVDDHMIRVELKRLIGRSYQYEDKKDAKKKTEAFTEVLYQLYSNSKKFDDFLSILDFLIFMKKRGEK